MNAVRISELRRLTRELVGYGLVSGAALAVDSSILAALVKLAGWPYLPASALAFVCGGVVAYVLSVKFVFRLHRVQRRSLELGSFLALGVVGLGINALVLFLGIGRAGLSLFAAKSCAVCCTFATNFALRRQILFVQPRNT
jgi:putative flippase GtrA